VISGRTDNQGVAVLKRLSGSRAGSIVARLISRVLCRTGWYLSVAAQELPVAVNGTENGRALNRRRLHGTLAIAFTSLDWGSVFFPENYDVLQGKGLHGLEPRKSCGFELLFELLD